MTASIAKVARIFERTGYIFLGVARRLRRRFGGPGKPQLTIAIVIPLTGDAANWLQRTKFDWLARHGTSPGLEAAPHITLKMGCKVGDPAPIADYVAQLAAQTTAPHIALQGVGRFDDGILFLDVAASDALDRLRRGIVADLQNKFGIVPEALEGDAFHFHATIGHGLPAVLVETEYRQLQGRSIRFEEMASAIELWVHVGSNWATYHRARFKAPSQAPSPMIDMSNNNHG